ncbi:MAG: family 20 glycosylhydrolase, partial [Chitinophagaceae bacterium]
MTPNSFFYLDYYQGDPKTEPLAIGGNLPLSKTYSFDVDQLGLSPEDTRYIVGVQANVWTEYISNISYAEYMTYPRALALAEIGWSPREARDFESFKKRLIGHLPHMDAKKINYSKAFLSQK